LPRDLTDPNICGDFYVNVARSGLPDPRAPLPQSESIHVIAARMLALAQENILLNGGRITPGRFTDYCRVPEHELPHIDSVTPAIRGPFNLTALALEAGLSVAVDASVARYDQTKDRNNLASIIDGVVDNSYNGVKPYWTNDPDDPNTSAEVWFEIRFSSPVLLTGVTFYGGDILWSNINRYYRDDQLLGSPLESIDVSILQDGLYVHPQNLLISLPPDPWEIYQTVTATLDPTIADGIRLTGVPAGDGRFVTILELDPKGTLIYPPDPTVTPGTTAATP
jgi:hypothetical protein